MMDSYTISFEENTTLGDRKIALEFRSKRHDVDLSQAEFAERFGMTQSMISRLERGFENQKLEQQILYKENLEKLGADVSELNKLLEAKKKVLDSIEYKKGREIKAKKDVLKIPEFNVLASAGHGAFQGFEEIIEYHEIPTKFLPSLSVLSPAVIQVTGDSMYPTVNSGDYIVVQLDQGFREDGIYLIRIDDTVHVKRLQREFGAMRIMSDNPIYSEMSVSPDDGQDFQILGKVLTTIKKH